MRHRKKGRQLSRSVPHRRATLRNLATSLFQHGRIETTTAKAKELRPYAERLITLARRGDVHARRLARQKIQDRDVLGKLFDDIAPRYAEIREQRVVTDAAETQAVGDRHLIRPDFARLTNAHRQTECRREVQAGHGRPA